MPRQGTNDAPERLRRHGQQQQIGSSEPVDVRGHVDRPLERDVGKVPGI
jgi:hypothetical protein